MSGQAEALRRLSELLPSLLREGSGARKGQFDLKCTDRYRQIATLTPDGVIWGADAQMRLEYALRGEIEARGWRWAVESTTKLYRAFISDGPVTDESDDGGLADTPALALSLALIAVLEATP